MEVRVALILVDNRKKNAITVQKILSEWGCLIKTRLGLHPGTLENCTDNGLIFLELVGEREKHEEMVRKLNLLDGVEAKLVELSL